VVYWFAFVVDGTNKNSGLPGNLVHFACSPTAAAVNAPYEHMECSLFPFTCLHPFPVCLIDSCACFEGVIGWALSSFSWCYARSQASDFGSSGTEIKDV